MQASSPTVPSARSTSLAGYAAALGEGSLCFCCGERLRAHKIMGSTGTRRSNDLEATCPSCGSEVGVQQLGAVAGPATNLKAHHRLRATV